MKPFVKRNKNDRADAEAMCEAAGRPGINFIPVKSAEQQAAAMVLSVRELLVKQHTQLVNAVRGHAAEFGVITAKGTGHVEPLLARIADDPAVPEPAGAMFAELGGRIAALSVRLTAIDRDLIRLHRSNPVSQLLAEIPGVGPISALSFALTVGVSQFKSGFGVISPPGSAWTPKQKSTTGKRRLWAGSRARATNGWASCWCSAQPPWSALSNQAAGMPAPGCWPCCSAVRASSRRSPWPTRWPVSCGPCSGIRVTLYGSLWDVAGAQSTVGIPSTGGKSKELAV